MIVKTTKPKIGAIDKVIGKKIHQYRVRKGYSRNTLAKLLGVTHQQVGKYETGGNRVSAGMLYRISKELGVLINDFFDINSIDIQRNRKSMMALTDFSVLSPNQQNVTHEIMKVFLEANKSIKLDTSLTVNQ